MTFNVDEHFVNETYFKPKLLANQIVRDMRGAGAGEVWTRL